MSAPERIHAWPDKTPGVGWHLAHASKTIIGPAGAAEYIRADTVAETIRLAVEKEQEACAIAAGNAAVEALLRQEPDAGLLRRQMVRTNAIRAVRLRGKA